tara:strand:- start:505 stop:849 length:345 start_codon:yes stop_codon:yes gene_type:complete
MEENNKPTIIKIVRNLIFDDFFIMRLIKKIEKRLKIGYKTKRYLISLISLLYAYNAGKIKTNVYNNTVIFLLSIFLKNKINPTGANIMKDGIKDHPKNLVKPVTPCEKNSGKVL